jgi:hypothetical protein
MEYCILCGKDLKLAPTNLEHYVPATAIRNFAKVGIPDRLSWALRVDIDDVEATAVLAPRNAHKRWAVVRVHTQCNTDASPMCQDLKKIIDNIDNYPQHLEKRIKKYYAHLWSVRPEDVGIAILSKKECEEQYEGKDAIPLYSIDGIRLGRILILNLAVNSLSKKPVYEHLIAIGTKEGLEKLIKR